MLARKRGSLAMAYLNRTASVLACRLPVVARTSGVLRSSISGNFGCCVAPKPATASLAPRACSSAACPAPHSALATIKRISELDQALAGERQQPPRELLEQGAELLRTCVEHFDWQMLKILSETACISQLARELPLELEMLTNKCLAKLADEANVASKSKDALIATLRILAHHHKTSESTMAHIRGATPALLRGLPGVTSPLMLLRLLNSLGARYERPTDRSAASVELVWSVYDRLAATLDAFRPGLSRTELVTVYNACDSAVVLQVRHAPFLAAWERLLARLVAHPRAVRSESDLRAAARCFSELRCDAPTLFAALQRRMAAGDVPCPRAGYQAPQDMHLAWAFLAQGLAPPPAPMRRLADAVASPTFSPHQLTGATPFRLEQLVTHLPHADAAALGAAIAACRSVGYLLGTVRRVLDTLAGQRLAEDAGVHVDAQLPGGRVPLVAMLSADGAQVLPWPEQLPPLLMTAETARRMLVVAAPTRPCVPVAVLFASRRGMLRRPAALGGLLARQRGLLGQHGFRVLVVAPELEVAVTEHGGVQSLSRLVLNAARRCGHVE